MADTPTIEAESFGPNIWLIDEMYRRFAEDPGSVSPAWQEFFADYGGPTGESTGVEEAGPEAPDGKAQQAAAAAPAVEEPKPAKPPPAVEPKPAAAAPVAEPKLAAPSPPPATQPEPPSPEEEKGDEVEIQPLIGISATIAKRMDESLEVPTATSVRTIPAKLLEVNRRMINNQLGRLTQGGKVSFTHMIGFAVARALADMPEMNVSYTEIDGKPHIVRHGSVNLGLAVDQVRSDGTRVLLVPNVKGAEKMDFQAFWLAYEELIHRVRQNRLTPDDFAGTTATLTNPGTIGTAQSVPRLMPDQGVIVGVGAINYPPEYLGADEKFLARQGISRVVALTSTYDHRVIQGALSGEFLGRIQALLLGESGFYDDIFSAMKIPYTPARWAIDDNPAIGSPEWAEKQGRVFQIINMYRVRGHLIADLDPLRQKPPQLHPELDPLTYGLTIWDLDREFATGGLGGHEVMKLGDALSHLRDSYCRTAGVEYMHIQEPAQKAWIQERVEAPRSELPREERLRTLRKLNQAEAFERFLHTKYVGHKRFGLEGAESLIPLLDTVLNAAAEDGMEEVVIGMAHRGRLNVLANIIGKSYSRIFGEFEGLSPETIQGSGDVKYHLGAKGSHSDPEGRELSVQVVANPSHLEAVDPVLEGQVRAKQELRGPNGHEQVLPIVIHGDAAFAGQGVVVETLNLSQLPGYRTGGTVHIVVNNQVGFTTSVGDARSSHYATDVAKTVQAPILHVNGDDPDAVVRVAQFAFDYRQVFNRDVVIDMVCYRRRGHNEGDEPSYTQPLMYRLIEQRRSVRKLYMERLVNTRELSVEEGEKLLEEYRGLLEKAFAETKDMVPAAFEPIQEPPSEVVPSPVSVEQLQEIAERVSTPPEGFTVHPKLTRLLEERRKMVESGTVDWAVAEAFAIGSLAYEGHWVRLTGEDSQRGTFSHRHAALTDYQTGVDWVPLQSASGEFPRVRIVDSLLSEFAAVGFEYGYSVEVPDALVMWEAQFGDFGNGAQVVIDQFISAGADKWGQRSALVMLLPHGYEGQGPEHSSGRIERYLQMCAGNNLRIVVPSTSGSYFHALRRQVSGTLRRPMVMFTPKSLLRTKETFSTVEELTGGGFRKVLGDPHAAETPGVRRLVLCSGKVYYDLERRRRELQEEAVALIRMEQLYPFPEKELNEALGMFLGDTELVWAQEEPANMGAWSFLRHRLAALTGREPFYAGRPESASPATGNAAQHQAEQAALVDTAIKG